MSDAKTTTRKLIPTACKAVYTGKNSKGADYTIYEVSATKEDGSPVELPLRSFDDLTSLFGKIIEFEVTPYTNDHGTTYTLKPPREKLGPRVERLEKLVRMHEERITKLEGR